MATWDGVAGVEIVEHAADDLPALVQAAVPALAPHVLRMRAAIERDDIAKYCALFCTAASTPTSTPSCSRRRSSRAPPARAACCSRRSASARTTAPRLT